MEMRFEPELTTEQVVVELQQDVKAIRKDVDVLEVMIRGNGDPTKSLLWAVATLEKLVANQAALLMTQAQALIDHTAAAAAALEAHRVDGHYQRSGPWQRLGYKVLEHVLTTVATVVLALLVVGILVAAGSHTCVAGVCP